MPSFIFDFLDHCNLIFLAQEIHHRFSGMRTTYKNNSARVKKSISTGAAAEDIYEPSWIHYESMQFLDDCIPNRTSLCSYTTQQLNEEQVEYFDLTEPPDPLEKSSGEADQSENMVPKQMYTPKTVETSKPVQTPRSVSASKPVIKISQTQSSQKSKNSSQSKDKQGEVETWEIQHLKIHRKIGVTVTGIMLQRL